MAAGMQDHNITGRNLAKITEHPVNFQPFGFRIIVAVTIDFKTCIGKDAVMIGPGGRADPDLCLGFKLVQQVGADLQGPGAAGSMDSDRS